MKDEYTNAVLQRAQALKQAEMAAEHLQQEATARERFYALRAALAAAIGALMALVPTVSAAAQLL